MVFGPRQLTRNTGNPSVESISYAINDVTSYDPLATLVIRSGTIDGDLRASSAIIRVNGVQVVTTAAFSQQISEIRREIPLSSAGTIDVEIRSAPAQLTISIEATFRPGRMRIGPSGGVLYDESGQVRLNVPAGALTEQRLIAVDVGSVGAPANPGAVAWVGPLITMSPSGLTFSQPVELRVNAVAMGRAPDEIIFGYVTDSDKAEVELVHTHVEGDWTVAAIPGFSSWIVLQPLPLAVKNQTYQVTAYADMTSGQVDRDVQSAVDQWAYHLAKDRFTFSKVSSNPSIEIQFDKARTRPDATYIRCTWLVPICTPGSPLRGIRINPSNSPKFIDDVFANSPLHPETIVGAVTHELGHVLGLYHHSVFSCPTSNTALIECWQFASGNVMARYAGHYLAGLAFANGPMALSCDDIDRLGYWGYNVDRMNCAADITPISPTYVSAPASSSLTFGDRPAVKVVDSRGNPVGGVTVGFVRQQLGRNYGPVLAIETSAANGIARMPALTAPSVGDLVVAAVLIGPAPLSADRRLVRLFTVSSQSTTPGHQLDFTNYCTAGPVNACASVQVGTTQRSGGGTDVEITVRNLQGDHPDDHTGMSEWNSVWIATQGSVNPLVWPMALTPVSVTGTTNIGAVNMFPCGSVCLSNVLHTGQSWLTQSFGREQVIYGCNAPTQPLGGAYQTCTPGGMSGAVRFKVSSSHAFSATDLTVYWRFHTDQGVAMCFPQSIRSDVIGSWLPYSDLYAGINCVQR